MNGIERIINNEDEIEVIHVSLKSVFCFQPSNHRIGTRRTTRFSKKKKINKIKFVIEIHWSDTLVKKPFSLWFKGKIIMRKHRDYVTRYNFYLKNNLPGKTKTNGSVDLALYPWSVLCEIRNFFSKKMTFLAMETSLFCIIILNDWKCYE